MAAGPNGSPHPDDDTAGRAAETAVIGLALLLMFGVVAWPAASARLFPAEPLPWVAPPGAETITIDPNTATRLELMTLPGLGPALTERILTDRELGGPFATADDLTRVKGIGPKTLERLRPFLRVEAAPSTPDAAVAAGGAVPPTTDGPRQAAYPGR